MVSLFASVCVLVSCTGSSTQGDRAQGIKTAQIEAICREARGQILTIRGGEDIALLQCELQSDGDGGSVMVFSFNDNLEWYSLLTTMPTEDLVFTIPLGLVAYAFGRAGVSPANFSQVVISFDDGPGTVYTVEPDDLLDALAADDEEEFRSALLTLRDTMTITTSR